MRRGYGWNFPAGDHARCGVGAFERVGAAGADAGACAGSRRSAQPVRRHGGVIPHLLRAPVAGGVLFVGDAAGHCLPLSAEGIRAAVYFGTAAGRLVGASLRGELARAEALRRYAALHEAEARHYAKLLRAQRRIPEIAPRTLGTLAHALTVRRIQHWIVRRYLAHLRRRRARPGARGVSDSRLTEALAALEPLVLEGDYALLGYERGTAPPSPPEFTAESYAVRVDDPFETTMLVRRELADRLPPPAHRTDGLRVIVLVGQLDPDLTGFMSTLAGALAERGIPLVPDRRRHARPPRGARAPAGPRRSPSCAACAMPPAAWSTPMR